MVRKNEEGSSWLMAHGKRGLRKKPIANGSWKKISLQET